MIFYNSACPICGSRIGGSVVLDRGQPPKITCRHCGGSFSAAWIYASDASERSAEIKRIVDAGGTSVFLPDLDDEGQLRTHAVDVEGVFEMDL